jgi:hypothetical protein
MSEDFAPRPTGKPLENIELTGKLFPWGVDDQPVFLQMPACGDFFLPLFSTEDGLRLIYKDIPFAKIKKVDDGPAFLASLPHFITDRTTILTWEAKPLLRVIVDPWFTPEGRVRFLEIQRGLQE